MTGMCEFPQFVMPNAIYTFQQWSSGACCKNALHAFFSHTLTAVWMAIYFLFSWVGFSTQLGYTVRMWKSIAMVNTIRWFHVTVKIFGDVSSALLCIANITYCIRYIQYRELCLALNLFIFNSNCFSSIVVTGRKTAHM